MGESRTSLHANRVHLKTPQIFSFRVCFGQPELSRNPDSNLTQSVHQSCSDFLQSAEDKEWECFHSQLKDIPHSFLMENQELVSTNSLRRFKDVLRSDLRYGFKTGVETARSRNLLAYVLVSLRQFPEALSQTEEALKTEGEQHNLVSLANKAVILWQMGRRQEAQHEVSVIQGMKQDLADFDYLKIKAKAELAFSYNRMGPALYDHAERLFPEVIAEAREPEVWLWKFGLAMTKRRFLNFQHAPVLSGSKDTAKLRETLRQTLGLFLDITQNCHDSSLKAKAYAELAVLLNMKWDAV
nr:hypothetical protein BaRGS_021352 [Batillaria attramentaria]